MNGVWGHRLRACAVAVLLGALAVGVPYLLVKLVGNPFPSSLPSADELRILLTQNGQGFANFIIGTLAVLIWVMWLQLMIALVVEIVATVRRSESRRLPVAPGIQSFAARLIAALTLATTLTAAPLLTSAAGALDLGSDSETPSLIVTSADLGSQAPLVSDAPVPESAQGEPSAQASLTLHDSTELWDLAESAYGDGVMWKTIAAANSGRVDAAGERITETTEVVAQGTELVLPGAVDGDGLSAFGAAVVVEAGDSMWSIAQTEVESRLGRPAGEAEIAAYWSEVVQANADVSSGDVDLIYPGESLAMPGVSGEDAPTETGVPEPEADAEPTEEHLDDVQPDIEVEAAAEAEVAVDVAVDPDTEETTDVDAEVTAQVESAGIVTGSDAVSKSPPPARVHSSANRDQAPAAGEIQIEALGLGALGASLLCMGAVGALRRRRDLQRRTRPAGSAPRPSSTEAAAFEAAMRHASDELRESELDAGWRALPAEAVDAMRQSGPLQIHAEASGVLRAVPVLDDADENDDPTITLIDLTDEAHAVGDVATIPTSLIIGTDPSTGEAVLLDLASAMQVRVEGTPAEIRRFARSAVVDLAVSERADDIRVIAVGVGRELVDLERVVLADDCIGAVDAVKSSGHAGDPTTPLVVVSTVDVASIVTELADNGVMVVAPDVQSDVKILLDGDEAVLDPAGTSVRLASLTDDDYRSFAELVEVTSTSSVEPVHGDALTNGAVDIAPADECPIAAGAVDVKVLGPVEVAGAAPFSSLKAVDVIAYLAFHRNGVDADQIKSWVWPTFEPPTDKALANVLSRARTGLGASDDGEPYLSRAGVDKTYRLSPEVTTDFDRFRALVDLADADDDPANQLKLLKRALELIRGVPFTGGAASSFAWADNHVRAQVEFTIDETVHRCADLALELGDVETARWSALKGLELVPGCEQCFRRRFLVASANNNRSELRRAMADLERSAAIELGEPEAIDTISGDLLDLYHQLDRALVGDSL